ncbi:MAG: DNA primase [Chloroflexi bacterium RBG_13_50_21]|nr:MAG: DNA primase [Chloroflexi bacterium RBG_13_50_21]OGO64477.1 MAG: DNA primase [Chloroflexi bacterium RBG_19FT_COMBO_47_9]
MSSIDEIKSRIDIVDLVSESVQLRRTGKNYIGFCPFHPNTRTPSFVVFPVTGTWRCFGQCSEGGDIFSFTMKKQNWDFQETLKYLAEKAGVQLKPPTPQELVAEEEHAHLRSLLEEAVIYYHHQLRNTPEGQKALVYLHGRGLSEEIIETFGLGYAPNSHSAIIQYFKSKGRTETNLKEAGLVSERDDGSIYDKFRHRIIFPIRDARGRMAGFGGRVLNPDDIPKFLNSPQTAVFDKSALLYGLELARTPIRALDQAVIVEGYLDVIALHQAGFTNTVSPMGTALTEHQLRLLKRLTQRFILALDPDAAGDKATLRGLQIARQTMDRGSEPVFDARGLLAHETRLQADIRVTTLPPGMDPDDVVKVDPAAWQNILENAKPVVIHVMETLAAGRDVDDPKTRSEIASQVLPLINEVPDAIERETYRQRLARLIKVDERLLSAGESSGSTRRRRPKSTQPKPTEQKVEIPILAGSALLEAHILGILVRRPEMVFHVDRALHEAHLSHLTRQDFERAEYQAIFELVQESLAQDQSEPMHFVLNGLSLPLMEVVDNLLERTEKLDPKEERVLEDVMRALLEIRRRQVTEVVNQLRFQMDEAAQAGDLRTKEFEEGIAKCTRTLRNLHQARERFVNRAAAGR